VDSPVNDSDEQQYAAHAEALRRCVIDAVPAWIDRVLEPFALRADAVGREAATAETIAAIDERLTVLATSDPDVAMSGPLELIRQSTVPLQRWLAGQGAAAPTRDPWDVRSSPDDVYELGPMTFRDLSEEVHVAGITWGAAKAHIHLRRRSQRPDDPSA